MKLKSCCKQHNNRIDSTSRNSHDEWSLRFSRVSARGVKLISGFAKCHPIEKAARSGHTEKCGGHHKSRKIIITIMKGIIAEGMQQQATNVSAIEQNVRKTESISLVLQLRLSQGRNDIGHLLVIITPWTNDHLNFLKFLGVISLDFWKQSHFNLDMGWPEWVFFVLQMRDLFVKSIFFCILAAFWLLMKCFFSEFAHLFAK